MKLRIKFMTCPEMDKCLKEMQELKDYMAGGYFMTKLIHKVNELNHFDLEDCFCEGCGAVCSNDITLEKASEFMQSIPLILIDREKRELCLDESKPYFYDKRLADIFFSPEMWQCMDNKTLKEKVLSWCELAKEKVSFMGLGISVYTLPVKAYEDGFLSVDVDMDNFPEIGSLDELLTQENGSTVIKLVGNKRDFETTNKVDEGDYYEEGMTIVYENIFTSITNLIGDFGKDLEELEFGETLIHEVGLVNDCGDKLQHIPHEQINFDTKDEVIVKFKVPGGKRYYDIDVSMNIMNNRVKYLLDFSVDLRPELVDVIKKFCDFVKVSDQFGVANAKEDILVFQLEALTWDYSPAGNIIKVFGQSELHCFVDSEEKVEAVLGRENNLYRDYLMMKGEPLTHYPKVVTCEENGVHDGKWAFKGVITGYTAADIENMGRIVQMRVAGQNISLKYDRVKESK